MNDASKAALSMALEYHRHVDPASWNYPAGMMGGGGQVRNGGGYSPEQVVKTAKTFAAFLNDQPKRRGR